MVTFEYFLNGQFPTSLISSLLNDQRKLQMFGFEPEHLGFGSDCSVN